VGTGGDLHHVPDSSVFHFARDDLGDVELSMIGTAGQTEKQLLGFSASSIVVAYATATREMLEKSSRQDDFT
jgi:hypothetical protein